MEAEKEANIVHPVEDSPEEDFVSSLYSNGFHEILEKVTLNLTPRSAATCKKVSKTWQAIVNDYSDSKISRLKAIQEQRINKKWLSGSPILDIFSMPGAPKYCHSFHHVVLDELIVAVAGVYSDSPSSFGNLYIHVFDFKTLELIKLIPVSCLFLTEFNFCPRVTLTLTEDLLHITGQVNGKIFSASWNRKDDYSLNSSEHLGDVMMPLMSLDTGPEGSTQEICIQSYLKSSDYLSLIDRGYKIQIDETNSFAIAFGFTITAIGYYRGDVEVWRKAKRKAVKLVGFDEDYVGVSWQEKGWTDCVVEVFQRSNGALIQRFDLSREFRTVFKVQFSHGRIAIRGQRREGLRKTDLYVFDLRSGKKLLQSRLMLNPWNDTEDFALAKDRVILLERGSWAENGKYGKLFSLKYGH